MPSPEAKPPPQTHCLAQPKLLLFHPEGDAPFELEVVTEIKAQENTLLEGLYKSGGQLLHAGG